MSASPGCGASARGSRPSSRTPSSLRISASASRPARSTALSEASARSGSELITRRAPPAWITITDTLCAITSCSSRAIRDRSW